MKIKLKKHFVRFNVLVISAVLLLLMLILLLGQRSEVTLSRWLITGVISIVVVYIASNVIAKRAIAPIEESWQNQLDFTSSASHELRTPLAVIKTSLEIIMDNPEESVESQMRWLENIYAETERMSRLTEDLLWLSRSDEHKLKLDKKEFQLNDQVRQVVSQYSLVAKQKKINIKLIDTDVIQINAIESQMKQLLLILLDNAVKYTKENGNVTLSLAENNHSVVILVKDTGIGIPEDELVHVFERFYRVDKARNSEIEGSGLGLAIAKDIVSNHNGTIEIQSKETIGTEIVVTIPK